MKIMRLSAGLGNTMFQYATYLQLKKLYPNDDIFIDTIWFKYTGFRYDLDDVFHISDHSKDFYSYFCTQYNSDLETEMDEMRYWKKYGFSSWYDFDTEYANTVYKNMSYQEIPELYCRYCKGLRVYSDMNVHIKDIMEAYPNIQNNEEISFKSKVASFIEKHISGDAAIIASALGSSSGRKKYVEDIKKHRKPNFASYRSLDFLKQEGDVYFNCYGDTGNVEDVKQECLEVFQFPTLKDSRYLDYLDDMRKFESVAIHIRISEGEGNFKSFNGSLISRNYYKKAINYIKKHTEKPIFFVFSDDYQRCKDLLQLYGIEKDKDNYIMVHSDNVEHYRDMQLISMCKHAIIPSSTYSWWGAFLNSNPDKIVVTPYRTLQGTVSF